MRRGGCSCTGRHFLIRPNGSESNRTGSRLTQSVQSPIQPAPLIQPLSQSVSQLQLSDRPSPHTSAPRIHSPQLHQQTRAPARHGSTADGRAETDELSPWRRRVHQSVGRRRSDAAGAARSAIQLAAPPRAACGLHVREWHGQELTPPALRICAPLSACRPLSDEQSAVAASQLRRSVVIATSHLVTLLGNSNTPAASKMAALARTDWKTIDVNLSLRNGLTLHAGLAAALRASAAAFEINLRTFGGTYANQTMPALTSAVQQSIVNKLLEYAPTAPSLQPSHPRDADELLQWMAVELAPNCGAWLLPAFIQLLLTMLQQRGFDLNRRDAAGRTLLTAFAAASHEPTAVSVACHLMQLGADASLAGSDGRSAICIWVETDQVGPVQDVLIDDRHSGLQQHVDLWQRDASGRTLLECMQSKGDIHRVAAGVMEELQQHWAVCERPLLQRILTAHASIIPDLARLTLDYIDGGAGVAK